MSKYTTEVRYICETLAGLDESVGYNDVDSVLNAAYPQIFDYDFPAPLNTTARKKDLCTKILRHYYTREIGLETAGLWQLKLKTRMLEILPYYAKMYATADLEYEPFVDVDYWREGEGSNKESGSNQSATTNKGDSQEAYSDTPQGGLSDVTAGRYLTNATARKNNDTSTTNMNDSRSGSNKYNEHIHGKQGGATYAAMLEEYRNSILRIDAMLIDELSDLFFMLW